MPTNPVSPRPALARRAAVVAGSAAAAALFATVPAAPAATPATPPASPPVTVSSPVVPLAARSATFTLNPQAVAAAAPAAVRTAAMQKALGKIGAKYRYGASGPNAFDCSGFAQYIYKQLGRYLPRTAQQQYNATIHVPPSAKQPGDLIFFGTPDNITHMGIYAGNGYMWAAPRTGDVVKYEPIYTSRYYVGRVL